LTLDGVPVTRADDRGIAVVGVSRGQPEKAVIGLDLPLDQPAPFGFRGARAEVEVAPRKDGVSRFVMACGKIAPQTEAEARHAALSEEKKRQALETPRPPIGEVSFVAPATGPYSSPFGAVRTYVPDSSACEGRTSVHNGLDIAVPTGAQVRAPAAGEVVLADPDLYFEGGAVFIDHGRGLMSVLMHMSRLDVRTGERVAQGQALGLSGATGRVTGPHVHWGLKYRNGITNDRASDLWIDPSTVLTGSGADR
jgi:murein DD-endopeptidase MepM/ murein hydrolase activator NlpD